MTYDLYICAFAGAGITLLALVSDLMFYICEVTVEDFVQGYSGLSSRGLLLCILESSKFTSAIFILTVLMVLKITVDHD